MNPNNNTIDNDMYRRVFQSYCEEGYQISNDYTFPLPSLAKNQFINTLKLCGVELGRYRQYYI